MKVLPNTAERFDTSKVLASQGCSARLLHRATTAKRIIRSIHAPATLLLFFATCAIGQETAPAPPPTLEGIWKWTFTMPDGNQVTPRLEVREQAGQLIGTTRIKPGTEASVTNLIIKGNEISFEVIRENDDREVVTRYTGILSTNTIKGKIVSNWSGDEQSYDWEAHRALGAGGTWKWITIFATSRAESLLTLKQEGEKLTGKLAIGRFGETEIKKGKYKAGNISFETERERDGETFTNRFHGKLSGDKILGRVESNYLGQPRTNKWEAARVE